MYSKAIIDYQIASSYFKNYKKSGSQNSQITNLINLFNTHLVIGTLEQASITLNQLELVITNLPNHPRYKNLMELVKIPFILISSESDKTSRKLKTELGINAYLEKPFTTNEIISRVHLSLERTLNRKKIVGEKNNSF